MYTVYGEYKPKVEQFENVLKTVEKFGFVDTFKDANDTIKLFDNKPNIVKIMGENDKKLFETDAPTERLGGFDDDIVRTIILGTNKRISLKLKNGTEYDFKGPVIFEITSPIFKIQSFQVFNNITPNLLLDDIKMKTMINEVPTISAPTNLVTLYTGYNFTGKAVSLGIGSYPYSKLSSVGIVNDSISSIKVPSGLLITIYLDDIGSKSETIIKDINDLRMIQTGTNPPNFDKQISAFEIKSVQMKLN